VNPVAFIANSPAEALAQIHARLGPHAVVISVKPIRAAGMAGLLIGQRRVEVIATLPEPTEPEHPPTPPDCVASFTTFDTDQWPSIAWLSAMGLLPEYAAAIQQQVTASHATRPPSDAEEWTAVHAALTAFWKPPMPLTETGAA
jgi:flagellar biosynthesis GTPase FlhF